LRKGILIDALCFLSALLKHVVVSCIHFVSFFVYTHSLGGKWINSIARDFEEYIEKVIVEVDDVPWERIGRALKLRALSRHPMVTGNVLGHGGWADLTSFISETLERTQDWPTV
jgi:hypothetical protein